MLELHVLGSPTAILDGKPLSGALLSKDLALLYYLAITGQPQPRASLAVLLWGENSESAARSNLRKSISELRQQFGDHLEIERDYVSLVQTHCAVDLWEFERLAASGLASSRRETLEAAAALYRGELLAGFVVRNAVDYDRWLYGVQERLRATAVRVLTALAALHADAGVLEPAIVVQRRILELEPWREESHRDLMLMLAKSGQRSTALAQYKACVEVLAAELGVQPSAETAALAERIRDEEVPNVEERAAAPVRLPDAKGPAAAAQGTELREAKPGSTGEYSNLPPEYSSIVGRAKELDELSELLQSPGCRLVTILGEGGIGKTRLALALAHRLQPEYAHVGMVPLATISRPSEILSAIGRGLGLALGMGDEEILEALRRDNPHLLLVLDNFEHLLPEGVVILEQLLNQAPRLQCVVTSREALSAGWEWRYQLAELGYPVREYDTGTDPLAYSSVQMFLQVARRARPRQAIVGAELQQAMHICRLVGGMPLGIELAAAQAASLSCAAIADQIAGGIERLAAGRRDLAPHQRSLLASFDVSWGTLSAEEQKVLTRLAVINGEFTLDAALSIGAASVTDITRLVDKSLVRSVGGDLYSLHHVIQQHAAAKLASLPGAAEAVFSAYCDYYTAWVRDNANAYRLTDTTLPTHESAGSLEHHLRHLWHIWTKSKGQEKRSKIAVALTEAEHAYRTFAANATGAMNTWVGLESFAEAYTDTTPAYSGVLVVDVVWLPSIANQLVDLTTEFTAVAEQLVPAVVEACQVGDRLVAIPQDIDLGLLYCRNDLLSKYGYGAPPATWDELEKMAAVIQAGERAAGRRNFWGFVWPGHPAEAFTCTALEWQHSEGGGCIIEPYGRISIANERAAAAMARAAQWVGTISPPEFADLSEGNTVRIWSDGDAAFMRMWSAYSGNRWFDPMRPVTAIAVLPQGAACHAATLGGWPMAVHISFQQRNEAYELIKTIISPEVQRLRAQRTGFRLPVLAALYHDKETLESYPFLPDVYRVITDGGMAVRPHVVAGAKYGQVSQLYAESVAAILRKEIDAGAALARLELALAELGGWETR